MDDLIAAAARLLEAEVGRPVGLTAEAHLPSEHTLLRCRTAAAADLPATLLVKEAPGPRLRNEIAALRALATAPGPWPRLLAAGDGVAVVEDLGELASVEDLLLSGDPVAARCFPAMGTALAALHCSGARPPLAAPRSDSTYDVRAARPEFEDCFDVLGLLPPAGFWDAVGHLEGRMHGAGPFRTFIHADAGAQNFLWDGTATRLVDFEFATAGHALLDVVSARLGFPHSANARIVPLPQVEALEGAYVEAADPPGDVTEAVTDVCAHWALVRWAGLWRRCFRDRGGGDADMRSQAFTVYRRFVATASTYGHQPTIARAVDDYTSALQRRFPGLGEQPAYPALRQAGERGSRPADRG